MSEAWIIDGVRSPRGGGKPGAPGSAPATASSSAAASRTPRVSANSMA